MSVDHLRSSLLGSPLRNSVSQRSSSRTCFVVRGESNSRSETSFDISFLVRNHRKHGRFATLQLWGRNANLSLWNSGPRCWFRTKCTGEPLSGGNDLIRSFAPLWREGLLLIRCSIFFAVLSAAGLLVWYGQLKAKSFIEVKLLPSVCSVLSEYLQREIDFGKVRSVSPLGITLQSCSFGPYEEEFSCGESQTVKLRVRPFASLRRGKIVIDAILSNPIILVAQKEDFSWMGIPSPSESSLKRHCSNEVGIDYRTKTRRLVREETTAREARGRVESARMASEMGYIIPQDYSRSIPADDIKDAPRIFYEPSNPNSFFFMGEHTHWRDHHRTDMGIEYSLKHADLEKSFGVKGSSTRNKIWPRTMSFPLQRKLKRETHKKTISEARISSKLRILKRSAVAALAYFKGLGGGDMSELSTPQGKCLPYNGRDEVGVNATVAKDESVSNTDITGPDRVDEGRGSRNLLGSVDIKEKNMLMNTPLEAVPRRFRSDGQFESPSGIESPESGELSSQQHAEDNQHCRKKDALSFIIQPFIVVMKQFSTVNIPIENSLLISNAAKESRLETRKTSPHNLENGILKQVITEGSRDCSGVVQENLQGSSVEFFPSRSGGKDHLKFEICMQLRRSFSDWHLNLKAGVIGFSTYVQELLSHYLAGQIQKIESCMSLKVEDLAAELAEGVDVIHTEGIEKMLPVTLDSVYFDGGSLMLLAYGDREPREMEDLSGHVKFQNHYTRVHVQLSGNCKEWRSGLSSKDGGQLSVDVFVDSIEQKWHANLKIGDLFVPLFERILEIPVTWSKGRATGEVHICMSEGETFPNIHGQLDVNGLAFQILDAPSSFMDITASLCFRGQRIFLHNASGWFGDAPLEASGDFGINPEDGEFHLMCQVPCVEVNALMKTLKVKPLMFSLAGSVTAVFNCQGPLDAPVFVGSGMISRKTPHSAPSFPSSSASEAVNKNREAGAVAAFDHIPFSHVSANFTFNTDNCVADLYGIRASFLDGGEVRGAGNAWICPEGEVDVSAIDVNLSGNMFFDKVIYRYLPSGQLMPPKIGDVNGETKLSGSLLRPRFDIKWAAPKAEDSFSDARGDIIIAHEYITISSSSVAFDLYMKVQTSYPDDYWLSRNYMDFQRAVPLIVEGVDLDLRMRGFEFAGLLSSIPFDSPRPVHLRATGRIKFQGRVMTPEGILDERVSGAEKNVPVTHITDNRNTSLVGEVSLSGIKLNQLLLAPQLMGSLNISHDRIKLDATGRPDENLSVEVVGPLWPSVEEILLSRTLFSVSLQKGQLRANICYQPEHSANLEVRQLPLDELELASLRGTIQRAELQLNFQKRRGHGLLSVLRPKFSGILGEALDVAARWSGDVITVEKTILEQASSRYELQGEYVLPGTRDRYPAKKEKSGLFGKAMAGHLGTIISSMGRWRMRLEVPGAEVTEMLPLARLLSRSTDPAVRSRSKELFMQNLLATGFYPESLHVLLEEIRSHSWSDDVILEDIDLPGLAELRGHWHGSLDASGGGNGDTLAEFDFHGEDWEWGTYKTQRVLATGAYSNNDGLHLEKMFIQKDNATLHADGTLLGPITNLHFAILNFPVGLVPTLVQAIESSAVDSVRSLRQLMSPIKGILHMEGDLRGSLAKPECGVQVRLLDGTIGGIDLGRAEIVASITPTRRFLFNANFEPVIQSGHVRIQGSVPVTYIQNDSVEEDDEEKESGRAFSGWVKENVRGSVDEASEKKAIRDRTEEGWDIQLAESLKGLNWNLLDAGEVRIDADIKDGGMMLITALSPYANWLHGYADITLQVRGTVEQPVVDGSASFHRASVSSPVLQKPLTNFGGTVHVISNRLCISSLESRVSRKGKLVVKGNLPLKASESCAGDRIDLKCEVLEVQAKNMLSGQVDSQMQITGSMLQPNISGKIKLSHGELYLPHDKGNGDAFNRLASKRSNLTMGGYSRLAASGNMSRFFGSESISSANKLPRRSGKSIEVEKKMEQVDSKPGVDVRLTDLKLHLGPELKIVYPLILNFAVSGELELNGMAHPKYIRPKGTLAFENGEVNLLATQVRLKRDHLNIAKFEPDLGLDPTLDLALVGSEWQLRIQSRASDWQDNLVVTSTRSVDQDVLSPTEAARVFESQLAESLLEGDGQIAFQKLATTTLEKLMPRIEGKGTFGHARWRLVHAPQIPTLLSVDPTVDPLKSLANNISFGTEVEVQLGKRLQASVVRQMKDSEMAMQWTLLYQLTSRLRVLYQSSPSNRLLFEYSATSQD